MIHVIDNFMPNIGQVHACARGSQYIDWQGFDGVVYKRVSLVDIPRLQERIEQLMGPVQMLGMGFRLNFQNEYAGIHSDLGWGTHALVLYLSEGIGGTAFWEHKETKTERIDTSDEILFETLKPDWENEKAWSIHKFVELKMNRALIYESALYHSRYPFEAFGNSIETGRLIAVAFFTPETHK
jgi:hypothetical protein